MMHQHTLDARLELTPPLDHHRQERDLVKRTKIASSPDAARLQSTQAMQQPSALSRIRVVLCGPKFRELGYRALFSWLQSCVYLAVLVVLSLREYQLRASPHQYCWTVPHHSQERLYIHQLIIITVFIFSKIVYNVHCNIYIYYKKCLFFEPHHRLMNDEVFLTHGAIVLYQLIYSESLERYEIFW